MRVLWFSITPGLYDEKKKGTWIASLQCYIHEYCPDITLGLAFEYTKTEGPIVKDGVSYYPYNKSNSIFDKYISKWKPEHEWTLIKPHALRIIKDFKPDIIHVFGSEWQYGLVTEYINVPVVIHMQGFLNYYIPARPIHKKDYFHYFHYNPFKMLHYMITMRNGKKEKEMEIERKVMKINHYFMGRTQWDKNIVNFFSKGSVYYHCEEAIRPQIYYASQKWHYTKRPKMRLVTISSGSSLKGNAIILETAKFLKTQQHFNFEWRVTGNHADFTLFEDITGINHNDVNVVFMGLLQPDQIVEELSNADVYVHTAIIDNSPNSLCEAQLIGCPVVSANVGGIPSLVEEGKTGLLYPYNEPITLAFILEKLYGDKETLTLLSSNEIVASHKRHKPQDVVSRLSQIYEDIIKDYNNNYLKK